MKTLDAFLKEKGYDKQPETWHSPFDNWNKSLKLSLKILIDCAKQQQKIGYAGLLKLAEVPKEYTKGNPIGSIASYLLQIIGEYCKEIEAPKLTSLCVRFINGFPSNGFNYFEPKYDPSNPKEAKKILEKIFSDIDKKSVILQKIISVNHLEKLKTKADIAEYAFDRNNFYISNSEQQMKIIEEVKKEKDDLIDKLWWWGFGCGLFLTGITITFLVPHFIKSSEINSSWFWLLTVPVIFCLFNITTLLKIIVNNLNKIVSKDINI